MDEKSVAKDFPIICVGGSAGGLDAYTRLLQNLPSDMGVAIVIVNHLRTVATLLHEILPHHTKMPVELITERLDIQPNHVFIIPEKRDLHILDDEFRLKPISKPRGWPDVITVFLRSLTKNWDGKLIAVIVSGYDGDGAEALWISKPRGWPDVITVFLRSLTKNWDGKLIAVIVSVGRNRLTDKIGIMVIDMFG